MQAGSRGRRLRLHALPLRAWPRTCTCRGSTRTRSAASRWSARSGWRRSTTWSSSASSPSTTRASTRTTPPTASTSPARATSTRRGSRTRSRCGSSAAHFVECIRDGEEPRSGGESGLRVVRVLEELQQSLAESSSRRAELRRLTARPACCSARAWSCPTTWSSAGTWWCTRARASARARGSRTAAWSASRWRSGARSTRGGADASAADRDRRGHDRGRGRGGGGGRADRRALRGGRPGPRARAHRRSATSRWWAAARPSTTTCGSAPRVRMQTGCYVTAWSVVEDDVFVGPGRDAHQRPTAGRRGRRHELRGPTLRRACRIGAGAVLLPGVEVGEEAFVAAGRGGHARRAGGRARDGRARAGRRVVRRDGGARCAPGPRHAGARSAGATARGGARWWRSR